MKNRIVVALLMLAAFVAGQLDPIGWVYWRLAEWKLPDIKQASLAAPSPYEQIPKTLWRAESENALVVEVDDPQAPVHLVVAPKRRIVSLLEAPPALLAEMLVLARDTARQQGIAEDGFRLVINTNPKGAQSVYHLHMHVIGGRQMRWPPG